MCWEEKQIGQKKGKNSFQANDYYNETGELQWLIVYIDDYNNKD